ncbi:MAG: 50S ribosomal protein L10 [Bacteroidota bacterium]|nr:50S ribosomal protein L10 [Bacteroidota bacterium]MDP4190684.1 50S ribosomal protein L10 [Bacteroidota bacterium]MDP4194082.1 50S ribosomal protein L10 [Bacteroidota bacterium]
MDIKEKEEIVSQIKELIDDSNACYLVEYSKVDVADINNIRKEFRKEGVTYKVFKNTLFKKALEQGNKYEKLGDLLFGMTGFAFVKDNTTAPAKIIKKYFDTTGKLGLKGCYIENQFFEGKQLDALSTLPTKAEIVSGIIGSISSPASGIVGAISAVMRDLVSVVEAIEKQKAA